jgi:hypothetical protein
VPEPVVIVIPMMPPQECGPNWHGHWTTRHRQARAFRDAAYWAAFDEDARGLGWPWIDGAAVVVMDIAVAWAGRRKAMDSDNLIAATKHARDGVAACLMDGDDSRIQVGTVTQGRGEGVTVLTLREGE